MALAESGPTKKASCFREAFLFLSNSSRFLQCPLNFFFFVTFNDIANIQVVELLDADTAFETGPNFRYIILKAFQRQNLTGVNYDTIPNDPNFGVPGNSTIRNHTACNSTHFRNPEYFPNFYVGYNYFLNSWGKHTFHRIFQFVNRIVDDRVKSDVDLFLLSQFT